MPGDSSHPVSPSHPTSRPPGVAGTGQCNPSVCFSRVAPKFLSFTFPSSLKSTPDGEKLFLKWLCSSNSHVNTASSMPSQWLSSPHHPHTTRETLVHSRGGRRLQMAGLAGPQDSAHKEGKRWTENPGIWESSGRVKSTPARRGALSFTWAHILHCTPTPEVGPGDPRRPLGSSENI